MRRWLSVVLRVFAVCASLVSPMRAAGDTSRLLPEKVMVYVEVRSPKEILAVADDWLKDLGGRNANPLDGALTELAQDLGMTAGELRAQIRKMKSIAFAITDIDPKLEEPVFVWVADMGEARVLRDALQRQLKSLSERPVATVSDVAVYSDGGDFACVVGNYVLSGRHRLELVKDVVRRIKGEVAPSLAVSVRFRTATAAVHPHSPLVVWADVKSFYGYLKTHEAENDDLAVLDAALDLATIDSAVGELSTTGGAKVAKWTVHLHGENRGYAAVRTTAAPRTVTRFFSADYAVVNAGTLVDGRTQWRRLKALVGRLQAIEEEGEFVTWVGVLEDKLKTKIDEELANVAEYAAGLRVGRDGWEKGPELLFVLKVMDVNRARGLMRKAEDAARAGSENLRIDEKDVAGVKVRFLRGEEAESDYAYAIVGTHLLLSTSVAAVSDAVRTYLGQDKCIFDEPGARKVLANIHPVNAKVLLVQPLGFLPTGPRNPHAPPPVMLGASTIETPRRLDLQVDCTHLGSLLRLWLGIATVK
ncbi:MAG: hypothetical protein AMS16_03510 [Planctomycetes bacterium DG_58]|nr:MAG: hypothetical protein AMS16_03510 [Planctomycetes bacterium DG_58]